MLFIADEHIPPEIVHYLRSRGHEVATSRGELGVGATDPEIANWASAHKAIIISADKGFLQKLERRPGRSRIRYPGAGRVLFRRCKEPEMLERLMQHMDRIEFEYLVHQDKDDPRLLAEITPTKFTLEL